MSLFNCDDLYSLSSLKRILSYYDLSPAKGLGQNFLFERAALEKISEATGEMDELVEIGSGIGSLTCLLKEDHRRVIAVEIDDRLEEPFNRIAGSPAVTFLNEDFLALTPADLELRPNGGATLVGNIPYHLTAKMIEKGMQERSYFSGIVFTVQREVAERILAEPGSREVGPITFLVRGYAEVEKVTDVSRDSFYPRPDVDSTTIQIVPRAEKNFAADPGLFFRLVRELFNYRRKTIRKGLIISPELNMDKESTDELLSRSGLDPRKRPENITIEELDELAEEVGRYELGGEGDSGEKGR